MTALPVHVPRPLWLLALTCAAALACGTPPPRPTAPGPAARERSVQVTPRALGAQARASDRALILGTTAAGATGTVIPLAEPATTVRLDVRLDDVPAPRATAPAVTSPLWLTAWVRPVAGARAAELAHAGLVDDDERYERLLARPVRPAAWAALQAVALVLGKDLSDLRYVAVPGPAIDPLARAPTAGALLAAAFLASLTGAPVASVPPVTGDAGDHPRGRSPAQAPDTARLTGLLLPDGAVLAPAGGPGDVHEAYARLTGRSLPAPVPVPARAMAVPAAWTARLDARYPLWRRALAPSWMQVLDMMGATRQPPVLAHLAREAERLAREAEVLRGQGAALPAYERMVAATTHASAAAALQTMLLRIRAGDNAGARDRLRTLAAAAAERLREARTAVTASVADRALIMAAHQWILRGAGAHAAGSQRLADVERALEAPAARAASPLGPQAERLIAAAAPVASTLAQAESNARRALDMLALAPASLAAPCPPPGATGDEANAIRHLALAHAAVTATGLPPVAAAPQAGLPAAGNPAGDATGNASASLAPALHEAVARTAIEHAQLWAQTANIAEDNRPASRPPDRQTRCDRALAALAAATLAQVESGLLALWQHRAALLAPQVSQASEASEVSSGGANRVLAGLVARAERKARQHARAAQVATGAIPVLARLEYTMARQLARDADDEAALRAALERFWRASMHAQSAVILARHPLHGPLDAQTMSR